VISGKNVRKILKRDDKGMRYIVWLDLFG